ncbi:IclR family transcriptional regulator [Nocardia aurea]|uniref:IclR family transcriptional regulator n=1 Tax=Nocardia aurea TaxID=2144174 RepID=A0ABV3FW65_9NOCA
MSNGIGIAAATVDTVPGPIQSIERAAAIMNVVAEAPFGIGVGELAAALDLPKTTAHGLLRTLVRVGYIEQEAGSGKYRVGAVALGLASRPLDTNVLRSYSMNRADALAARSAESVRIGALHGTSVRIAHHVFRPDDTAQTLRVGTELPLHATALGKVLLAYTPGLTERGAGATLSAFTRRTLVAPRALSAEVTGVRGRGHATDIGEFSSERASVAAPIRDAGGRVVGAIGLVGTIDRITERGTVPRPGLIELVVAAAAGISRDLTAARPGSR